MIARVAEETKQKNIKLAHNKQDISNSKLDQKHNKHSEEGWWLWVGASYGIQLPKSSLEENILQNSSWIRSVGSWESSYIGIDPFLSSKSQRRAPISCGQQGAPSCMDRPLLFSYWLTERKVWHLPRTKYSLAIFKSAGVPYPRIYQKAPTPFV